MLCKSRSRRSEGMDQETHARLIFGLPPLLQPFRPCRHSGLSYKWISKIKSGGKAARAAGLSRHTSKEIVMWQTGSKAFSTLPNCADEGRTSKG